MREELQDNMKRLMNFMNFARSFFKRKNPLKALAVSLISSLKDMLTIRQKLKMAKYRSLFWNHQTKIPKLLNRKMNRKALLIIQSNLP